MEDYNIEYAIDKINSKKTKEYFKEVSSSYFNKNYRASIVTLYSVVINDILIKLEMLEEIYSDSIAKNILDEIRTFQQENPTSPEWEKNIIENVKNRTKLIDNVDYAHIISLRNDRHLCAHPVLDKDDKLHTPNRETVAAHIRNMLESLFLKPPILSKKILASILEDVADKKELLINEKDLETYVRSKYLNSLNPTVEVSIFRELWKFIYKLTNEKSEENRLINYRVLYLLYKRNTAECIKNFKSEKDYFSNISNAKSNLNFIIRFLSENEFLYPDFKEDVHLLIQKHIENNINAKTVAWFLSDSYNDHLDLIKELVKSEFDNTLPFDANGSAYQRLIKIGIIKGKTDNVIDFMIWRYGYSKNFNDADKIFSYVIKPNLNILNKEKMEELCIAANKNSQVHSRKRAEEDHNELKQFIIHKFNDEFTFGNYKHVFQ